MNPKLLNTTIELTWCKRILPELSFLIKRTLIIVLLAGTFLFASNMTSAQWTALSNLAPDPNLGVMLLLSNGTVMCKTSSGGSGGIGDTWNLLTPDVHGSYAHGTWSTIARMRHLVNPG